MEVLFVDDLILRKSHGIWKISVTQFQHVKEKNNHIWLIKKKLFGWEKQNETKNPSILGEILSENGKLGKKYLPLKLPRVFCLNIF